MLCLLIVVFVQCNTSNAAQTQETERWDAVMQVHDEVMPLMAQTSRQRRTLKQYLAAENNPLPEDQQRQLRAVIKKLDLADETMMAWMSEFQQLSRLRAERTHEEIMAYLAAEKRRVDAMQQLFDEALSESRAVAADLN